MYSTCYGALALVALLASIDTVQCVECYQCTSVDIDPKNCNYPNDKLIVDCNSAARDMSYFKTVREQQSPAPPSANAFYYCAKLIMNDGDSSRNIVIRGCVKEDVMNETCNEMERQAKTHFGQVETALSKTKLKYCSTCSSERCNGAAGIAPSIVMAVGAAAVAYLAYH